MASRFPTSHEASQTFGGKLRKLIGKAQHRLFSARRPVGKMTCFLKDIAGRGFLPSSILDVGANKGNWSRQAAAIFPDANFILVEPQQEMIPSLQQFCGDYPKARFVEAGAGASAGELPLTIWDDLAGSSFLPNENAAISDGKERRTVKVVTIDSLYDDPSKYPELVKLDIQGFELEALKGAGKLFGKTELFILEVSFYEFAPNLPSFLDIVTWMSQKGYDVYDFPGFIRRSLDGALGQADVAFARRDGLLRKSREW
jgi:FkbM family methyltransferase